MDKGSDEYQARKAFARVQARHHAVLIETLRLNDRHNADGHWGEDWYKDVEVNCLEFKRVQREYIM